MSSPYAASFAELASQHAARLARYTDEDASLLRARCAELAERFGRWTSTPPSPNERSEALGELFEVNRLVLDACASRASIRR